MKANTFPFVPNEYYFKYYGMGKQWACYGQWWQMWFGRYMTWISFTQNNALHMLVKNFTTQWQHTQFDMKPIHKLDLVDILNHIPWPITQWHILLWGRLHSDVSWNLPRKVCITHSQLYHCQSIYTNHPFTLLNIWKEISYP